MLHLFSRRLWLSNDEVDDCISNEMCEFVDCQMRPSFSKPGNKTPRFCSQHRLTGMVNVVDKTCEFVDCQTLTLFSEPEEYPLNVVEVVSGWIDSRGNFLLLTLIMPGVLWVPHHHRKTKGACPFFGKLSVARRCDTECAKQATTTKRLRIHTPW